MYPQPPPPPPKPLTKQELAYYLSKISLIPHDDQVALLKLLRDQEKINKLAVCKDNFIEYVKHVWPSFISGRHHLVMADAFERIANGQLKRLIIAMPPRHALAVGTPIPTPKGFVPIQDLRPGDEVFHSSGRPVLVTGVSQIFKNRQCWRVTTDDNASLVCDDEHLWNVRLCRKRKVFRNIEAGALFSKPRQRKPMLPASGPVMYPAADLPVDPYVLGYWLGNGSSSQAIVTCNELDLDHVRQMFDSRGIVTTDQSTVGTFGTVGLKVKLRELGVLGNKHVPERYLLSSAQQRMDLLLGLMDSDGNVSEDGRAHFSNTNKQIIDSFCLLLRSLGSKANLTTSRAMLNGVDHGECYLVSFYMAGCSTIPRKAARARGTIKPTGRYVSASRAGIADTVCISVDSEDGMFLAGEGYIPTHNSKSEFGSIHLPSWYLGKFPDRKIIQCSNTAELAVGFGRKVRDLIKRDDYAEVFPNVSLKDDSKAAGRWNTNHRGEYFAIGTGGTVTGIGADLLVIDDPHSEQQAKSGNPKAYDEDYEWFMTGPRQRLQPNGCILIIATRWSKRDLTGRLLEDQKKKIGSDKWEYIELPAITEDGKAMWPEFWPLDQLEALRAGLPAYLWSAQYQQSPTSATHSIVPASSWRRWESSEPPRCEYIIQSWDTAYERKQRADYSACVTLGVFSWKNEENVSNVGLILLDAFKDKYEFPELKRRARIAYKYWNPDTLLIEAKAAGSPLMQELRRSGIPATAFNPVGKGDKTLRLNSVSDLFKSGMMWAPDEAWAADVITELADFPSGAHDDYVDAIVQALFRFRQGGLVRMPGEDDDEKYIPRPKADYY